MDTTKKARRAKRDADEADDAARRFEERLTWNVGDIEFLYIPEKLDKRAAERAAPARRRGGKSQQS